MTISYFLLSAFKLFRLKLQKIGDYYRGWVANDAELELLLTLHKQQTKSVWGTRQSPSMSMSSVHRSHWGRSYSVWGSYQTTVRQYTEGTLLIDIIDLEEASLIGEGAAQGRSIGNMRDLDQDDINQLVADVMAQLMP